MTDVAVACTGVTKRFGATCAVDDLTFAIPRGAVYGFLGQNGAGKTTTLRMLVGIYRPDAGACTVLGETDPRRVRTRLGYLPEEKGLYRKMRAIDCLAYFAALKGLPRRRARTVAAALLDRFGLGAAAHLKAEALSKGMGQKLQVLATLAHDPELLILDEPFSGLDPVNTQAILDTILDAKRRGCTVLFSTHVMEQAEKLCDAVLMIHRGKKRLDGGLTEVKGGARTITCEFEGDGGALASIPHVARVTPRGQAAEVELVEGADPRAFIAEANARVRLRRIDLREPSLHEIFLRTVREAGDVA